MNCFSRGEKFTENIDYTLAAEMAWKQWHSDHNEFSLPRSGFLHTIFHQRSQNALDNGRVQVQTRTQGETEHINSEIKKSSQKRVTGVSLKGFISQIGTLQHLKKKKCVGEFPSGLEAKDLALSLPWHRFSPGPGTSTCHGCSQKKFRKNFISLYFMSSISEKYQLKDNLSFATENQIMI